MKKTTQCSSKVEIKTLSDGKQLYTLQFKNKGVPNQINKTHAAVGQHDF